MSNQQQTSGSHEEELIENVVFENIQLGIIIRSQFKKKGITFFTPEEFSQQLGYMNRPKGYLVHPHIHAHLERKVSFTQEVLFVKSGKVRVDFFTESQVYLESRILYQGDVILLAAAGHGFEFLEESELIEVKQGPYSAVDDKIRFDAVTATSDTGKHD